MAETTLTAGHVRHSFTAMPAEPLVESDLRASLGRLAGPGSPFPHELLLLSTFTWATHRVSLLARGPLLSGVLSELSYGVVRLCPCLAIAHDSAQMPSSRLRFTGDKTSPPCPDHCSLFEHALGGVVPVDTGRVDPLQAVLAQCMPELDLLEQALVIPSMAANYREILKPGTAKHSTMLGGDHHLKINSGIFQ